MKPRMLIALLMLTAGPAAAQSRATVVEACQGVPEAENHLAVLMSASDVVSVAELKAREHLPDVTVREGDGARVVLARHAFVTADWLQRVINCHLARNAALGKQQPLTASPLDVAGATVNVLSRGGAVVVDITAVDRESVKEIRARARALATPR